MDLNLDKLALLAEDERSNLDLLRSKVGDPIKDRSGSASNTLAGSLRFLAVADYVVHGNVRAFREQLSEAVTLRLKLFERFDDGDPVSPSYVSMISYKSLLNAIAAGNDALAEKFAARMGGRDTIEVEYDRPFDRAFGYCLKAIVTRKIIDAQKALQQLDIACKEPENKDFTGYAKALHSIVDRNTRLLQQAFDEILAGHRKQSEGAGLFKNTEDEVLCVWGVAIANLARWHGLPPPDRGPLIPAELMSASP